MAKLKLAAIGDSLTQGFQSLAIYNTEWSFPAIIARSFGLSVPTDFRVPSFGTYGLPVSLETLLYDAQEALRPPFDAYERTVGLFRFIEKYLDEVEDYYERGGGRYPPARVTPAQKTAYHNLAVWGFTVSDSLHVTPALSEQAILEDEGWLEDDFLGAPSAPVYRTAQRVLNPGYDPARSGETQVRALERLIRDDGPLDVLIVWLGANDALRTVLELDLREMPPDVASSAANVLKLYEHNLTSEAVFRNDFTAIANAIRKILNDLSPATKVFVGNVPDVTVPPVMRGQGRLQGDFFDYYTRFFVPDDPLLAALYKKLDREKVRRVHDRIDRYNEAIRNVANDFGWHLVDTHQLLDELAVRRNGAEMNPGTRLEAHYRARNRLDHPLLRLNPIPSVLMYSTDDDGHRLGGGLIGLDGVHPTTIGYGLVAEFFLEAMRDAGVAGADPQKVPWQSVIASDWLIQHPPKLWSTLSRYSEQYALIWDALFRTLL